MVLGTILNKHSESEQLPMRTTTYFNTKHLIIYTLWVIITLPAIAQERMQPMPIAYYQNSNFETKLNREFNVEEAYKFVYLVEPSFSPEYCMTYDMESKSLVLLKMTDNYSYYASRKKTRKNKIKNFRLPVDENYADSLQSLFGTIINSASPDNKILGVDGTSYYFYLPSDIQSVVSIWSPSKESNCGQVVYVMERLCEAVEKNDKEMVEKLREEIIELAAVFRDLPEIYYNRPKPTGSK